MHPTHASRRTALATLAALACAGPAFAQPKVTRLLVAFPPGGPVDFVARTLAEQLGKELNQQVVVENRAGGNGAIAADLLMRSPADGTTLWLTSVGAVAINPSLYEKLAYDPVRDLAPVSLVANNVEVLVVGTMDPSNTAAEFIATARQRKEGITMASSGSGSVPHLAMELLADVTGAPLIHVPYKGAAPALTDTIAGHVGGFFGDIPGLINFVKAGKLKAIGIASSRRHPLLPDVKTFDEMGMPGVDSDNWYAIFAHRGTPAADVDRVNQALRRTLAAEVVKAKLQASGAEPAPSSPTELAALLRRDTDKWSRLVRAKKVKAD